MTGFITKEKQKLYKKFLSTEDYREVSRLSGFSFSTVNNILGMRTKINNDNFKVIVVLDAMTKKRMQETARLIESAKRI